MKPKKFVAGRIAIDGVIQQPDGPEVSPELQQELKQRLEDVEPGGFVFANSQDVPPEMRDEIQMTDLVLNFETDSDSPQSTSVGSSRKYRNEFDRIFGKSDQN